MKINKGQFSLSNFDNFLFSYRRGKGFFTRFLINRVYWHFYPRFHWTLNFPDHVDIEISSVCNMHCPMCYTMTEEYKEKVPRQFMTLDLFNKIVDECAEYHVYSIRLSLRGESLIHPNLVEMVKYAKKKGIKEISTLTNGLALTSSLFEQLLDAGLTWLTISVDGMDEVYNKIRNPAIFSDLLQKIKCIYEIKKKTNSRHPIIKVQSIWPAIKENPLIFYETFAPYVDLIASNPLIDYLSNDEIELVEYEENFDCPVLYQRLVIGSDGSVLLCSNDELGSYIIGDARIESLYNIWHGSQLNIARKSHKHHCGYKELEPCKHCYLPRKTKSVKEKIGTRDISVEYYIGRVDEIGK